VRITLLFFLSLCVCFYAQASEDSLALPTYFHTKHVLPAPWHTAEIIAQADYAGEKDTAQLRSLTIIVGKDTIKVPQRILAFFPGPRLGSFELYYGPPPDPELGSRRYLNVTFRYASYSYEGIYYPPAGSNAWIIIEDGRIKQLTKIEEVSDTVTTYTDFDPKTLKQTRKGSTTRVQ
jgi:hypothetical protein